MLIFNAVIIKIQTNITKNFLLQKKRLKIYKQSMNSFIKNLSLLSAYFIKDGSLMV